MSTSPPDLGIQDSERKNSPVAWEADEDIDVLRQEVPLEPICYFNDAVFSDGDIVKSGTVLLRCDKGLWVPAGPRKPDNN
jgi:hypothetical protein